MESYEYQIRKWQALQKDNYKEAISKLKDSGLLSMADNEFILLNKELKKLPSDDRRKLLLEALRHVSIKLIRDGNNKEDVKHICEIIIENWINIIDRGDQIVPSQLYEKSISEWDRAFLKLKAHADEEKSEAKKIKKMCTGTLKLFTSGSFAITDTLTIMASPSLIGFLMTSICSGALIFLQGIDDLIDK
jgi:hypothetical protein